MQERELTVEEIAADWCEGLSTGTAVLKQLGLNRTFDETTDEQWDAVTAYLYAVKESNSQSDEAQAAKLTMDQAFEE